MCRFEKNLNRIYTISGIILLVLLIMSMNSCVSSGYYKGCDGKKKFKTEMNYYQPHIECENCDEID